MLNKEKFLTYMKSKFGLMDDHFIYDTLENLVDYAIEYKSHTKDDLCFFLSDIIAGVEFGEVAVFEDDASLTSYGLEEKRQVQIREAVDAYTEFEQSPMKTYENVPVWMRAFEMWADHLTHKWSRLSNGAFPVEIGRDYYDDETKKFASNMDWDICKYCRGPCGGCEKKQGEHPCSAPCTQDIFWLRECTLCPVAMLKEVHQMRFKEID